MICSTVNNLETVTAMLDPSCDGHLSTGIGKSAFAPLLMSRLAKMGCKVVYKFKSANTHVLVLMDYRNMDNVQVDMQAYSEELLQTWLVRHAGLPLTLNTLAFSGMGH